VSENYTVMVVGNTACHVVTTVIFAPFTYRLPRSQIIPKEVTKRGTLSVVLPSKVGKMGEMEIDQRLRDLQREYLDFLDDEVLKLLYCSLYVKTYRDTSMQ